MARHAFGMSLTDWTFSTVTVSGEGDLVKLVGGATITFWNSESGGSQYTDLLDENAIPVTEIVSADGTGSRGLGTIPPFQGPDGITRMWASADGGPRALIIATDL